MRGLIVSKLELESPMSESSPKMVDHGALHKPLFLVSVSALSATPIFGPSSY